MHLELVDLLRCPKPHTTSVLVAAANRVEQRFVIDGTLGCPECLAEYPIENGVAMFAPSVSEPVPQVASRTLASSEDTPPHTVLSDSARLNDTRLDDTPVHDASLRLAAQLGLADGRSVFALVGYPAHAAALLRQLVGARLLLINPVGDTSTLFELQRAAPLAPLGALICNALPLVTGRFAGVAFAQIPEHSALQQWAAVVRSGGRIVAPVATDVPANVRDVLRELVRDDQVWVAQVEATSSAPVEITRRVAPR